MGKRKEGSMIAAAVLAFGGCAAVMAAQMSGPEVPEAVTPPAGHKAVMTLKGAGPAREHDGRYRAPDPV
jgi:hypothetical protein